MSRRMPVVILLCALFLAAAFTLHNRRYVARYLRQYGWAPPPAQIHIAPAAQIAFTSDALPPATTRRSGRPGPDNTGPVTPNNLRAVKEAKIYLDKPGQVLSGVAITGTIEIQANNVTLTNFTLDANMAGNAIYIDRDVKGTVISNGTISNVGPKNFNYAINGYGAFTADGLNIYNIAGSPILVDGASNPTVIENCWLHQIGWYASGITSNMPGFVGEEGTEHTDDIFMSAGNLTCINNNFDTPAKTTINGIQYASAAIFFIDQYAATPNNATVDIENNYINGGGYIFYLMGEGPATIKNNIIGPDFGYAKGFVYPTYVGNTPIVWSNNILQSSGKILSAPRLAGTSLKQEPD